MTRRRASALATDEADDRLQPRPHFHTVDALRGIGALAVLFWHYQSFYVPSGTPLPPAQAAAQPFHALGWPLYDYGWAGVQVFWVISGFVFAAQYLTGRDGSARAFTVKRLARLYPLHLATLLLVLVVQLASLALVGAYQVYGHNDAYHFLLHLVMASNWGLEDGYSFNAPVWSVSAEIPVYAAFFAAIPLLKRAGAPGAVLLAVAAWGLSLGTGSPIAQCAVHYFSGTALFLILARRPSLAMPALAGSSLAFALSASLLGPGLAATLSGSLALVGFCAAVDVRLRPTFRWMRFLGDLSYASYLLHMPIIMAILVVLDVYGISHSSIADTKTFFLAFFAAVIAGSLLTHRVFEMPARSYLLRTLSPRR